MVKGNELLRQQRKRAAREERQRAELQREEMAAAEQPAPPPPTAPGKLSWDFAKYFFFGGCILFVIFILVSVFKFTTFGIFTIDPETGQMDRIPVTQEMMVAAQYTSSPIPTNVSTTFKDVVQAGYTVGFDVYIGDGTPISDYYRVIFYNGVQTRDPATMLNQEANTGSPLSFASDGTDATEIANVQQALQDNFSNICMYIDPATNDLYLTYNQGNYTLDEHGDIAVDSDGYLIDDPNSVGWNTSNPIKNVPIGKPFRVTLAVDNQFIETYINGQLVLVTKTFIPGKTSNLQYYETSKNYNFYGPPDIIYTGNNPIDQSRGIKVANIKYWGQVLPSRSIRTFSSNPSETSVFTN